MAITIKPSIGGDVFSLISHHKVLRMPGVDIYEIVNGQFSLAKKWWLTANIVRIMILCIGIVSIFVDSIADWLGLAAATLTIAYMLIQWQSDRFRDVAESLLRKIELRDGLGWAITPREIADLLMSVPKKIAETARSTISDDGPYFTSATQTSPRRMLENLCESLWFTRHQAARMATYVGIVSALVLGIAVLIVITAWYSAAQQQIGLSAAKVAVAIIVFFFSAGYVRLAYGYASLATKARWFEREADILLQADSVAEVQAAKLLHEYQIVRIRSPMLPSWLWRAMEVQLNTLWEAQKTS